jgi:hypothetical protein
VDLGDLASERCPHGAAGIPRSHRRDAEVWKEGLKERLNGPEVAEDGRQVEAARQHDGGGESELVGPGMSSTVAM